MSNRRLLLTILAAGVIMLAVGVGPQFTGNVGAQAQTGVTVPYTGRLTDEAGRPVPDGAYAFTFALYAAETGGEPLWTETQEGVAVRGGAFTALLGSVAPLSKGVLDGGARWLEVGVRGPGEVEFTLLSPRQELSAAAPVAPAGVKALSNGPSCAHTHWGETWQGSGTGLYLNNTAAGTSVWLPGALSGVQGSGDNWGGVIGTSLNNIGVWGKSTNHYGGVFESNADHLDMYLGGNVGRLSSDPYNENSLLYLSSNADVIVKLDNDGGEDHVFRVNNSGGNSVFTVDEAGNMWALGSKSALVETASHGRRLLYAMESPEVWFEDLGTARLTNGEATVTFDPVFAETVNLEEDYHVFVTPLAQEPVILFVTAKTSAGFTVRGVTLEGKPARCSFDYRVIAKRLGYEGLRLETLAWPEGEP